MPRVEPRSHTSSSRVGNDGTDAVARPRAQFQNGNALLRLQAVASRGVPLVRAVFYAQPNPHRRVCSQREYRREWCRRVGVRSDRELLDDRRCSITASGRDDHGEPEDARGEKLGKPHVHDNRLLKRSLNRRMQIFTLESDLEGLNLRFVPVEIVNSKSNVSSAWSANPPYSKPSDGTSTLTSSRPLRDPRSHLPQSL